MTLATMDGLVAALPAYGMPIFKANILPQAIGAYTSLWTAQGIPGLGSNSSSGVAGDVPTSSTAGAYPFTNPVGPALSYLSRFVAISSIAGNLMLYDRLWQNSGLSPTSLVAQTVSSVALTRGPGAGTAGEMAEAWFQVYGVLGAGSTAPTISYTDQAGNTGNTGTLQGFVTTAAAARTFPFALATGDTGVAAIATYTNGATMTSGTFGLIIRRFVSMLSIAATNQGMALDTISGTGLPRIYDSACLELIWHASSTSAATINGSLALAQG